MRQSPECWDALEADLPIVQDSPSAPIVRLLPETETAESMQVFVVLMQVEVDMLSKPCRSEYHILARPLVQGWRLTSASIMLTPV